MDNWRTDLAAAIESGSDTGASQRLRSDDILRAEAVLWLSTTVVPALTEVTTELRERGRRVEIATGTGTSVGFVVRTRTGIRELDLKFRVRSAPSGIQVYARELVREGYREFVREWPLDRPVAEVTTGDIIDFVVARYLASVSQTETV